MKTMRMSSVSLPEMQKLPFSSPSLPSEERVVAGSTSKFRWSLTTEQAANILPICFLAVCGHLPTGSSQTAFLVYAAFFCLFTGTPFLLNRTRVRLDFVTTRLGAIFFGWILLSSAWSLQPLKVNAPIICVMLCAFLYINYIVDRFDTPSLALILLYAYTLMMVVSVLLVFGAPSIGIDSGAATNGATAGAWQGMFLQKNVLGLASLISLAAVLAVRPKSSMDRICRWTLLLLSTVCTIKSQSRETWASFLIVLAIFAFLRVLSRLEPSIRVALILAAVVSVIIVGVVVSTNLDAILALMGRDRTASGRTQVWDAVILAAKMRPWLGYGLYGFWPTPFSWIVTNRVGWPVATSHNEILEALVNYGIIGVGILFLIAAAACAFLVRTLLRTNLLDVDLHIYLLTAFLVEGTSSAVLMWTPSIALVLFLFGVAMIEKAGRLRRFRGVSSSRFAESSQAPMGQLA
jgi:O-antigen ligase